MSVGIIIFFMAVLFIGAISSISEYGASMLIAAIVIGFGLYVFFKEGIKNNNTASAQKNKLNNENNIKAAEENKNEIYIETEANDNIKNETLKEYIFPKNDLLD